MGAGCDAAGPRVGVGVVKVGEVERALGRMGTVECGRCAEDARRRRMEEGGRKAVGEMKMMEVGQDERMQEVVEEMGRSGERNGKEEQLWMCVVGNDGREHDELVGWL